MEAFLWKLGGMPPSLERLSSHPRPIFPHAACWRTLADLALAPCGDALWNPSRSCVNTLQDAALHRAGPRHTKKDPNRSVWVAQYHALVRPQIRDVVELLPEALFELLQRESTGKLGHKRVLAGVSSAVGDGWCAWDHRFGQYWP